LEVIVGSPHTLFPMGDTSRVGEARRHVSRLAEAMRFGEVKAGRLALVVTELGTNLCKHAQSGRLLVASRGEPGAGGEVEIIAIDEGPGIGNLDQCMRDGFSTGGSPGTGLGAIKRQADDFAVHTAAPGGTVMVARVRSGSEAPPAAAFRIGVVALMAPGEQVCGDGWAFASDGLRAALLLADGLGHGPDAEVAAQEAVRIFRKNPFAPLSELMLQAHATLRATRGAALAAAHLDAGAGTIRSAGAGNVMLRVASGVADKAILTQNGTVGVQVRKTEETTADWPRHAILAVYSDGIQSRWPASAIAPLLGADPTLAAAVIARDYCRGRDDATIMVIRRKE